MTSPKSMTSSELPIRKPAQGPMSVMRLCEISSAPFSIGGREIGKTMRERKIMKGRVLACAKQIHQRNALQLPEMAANNPGAALDPGFLSRTLGFRGDPMLSSFVFAVPFANLL